jgi:DNA-binding response OmpR family regulator
MNEPSSLPARRILVVEDETHLAQGLLFNMQAEGYAVVLCSDGETALHWLLDEHAAFDAIVLDVMLPGQNGFEVAAALRAAKNYTPVLMLTARSRAEDVLAGFAAGADDYLAKPFELSILLARLHSLLRRVHWTPTPAVPDATIAPTMAASAVDVFHFAGKSIDFAQLELHTPTRQIRLTLMEADLLRHLVRKAGLAVSRKEILEQVWHLREDTDTRAIDNFIVRLRRYIEDDPAHPEHLQTVRGVGYRFFPERKS